ncbi:hypothetical protein SAMN04489835_4557 [Mycolicibacterium rutilum]|uniref:Excreted virulence factor EspC, type VII ESX diderm n=1 Tax=Mycolicibacterium rutilum TaxID=370526 RepID=A0A1H6L7W4_MYCRU|nr:hypothetical protein [Mycolicibacterium rutilum]SEH82317.1 hypothetical protein SAMN04489835_4557 [Mycolicibacterium rutilum]
MTNPWSGLDAATQEKNLYLDPSVIPELNRVFEPYKASLQRLIDDGLDETATYFGTEKNSLAVILGKAFDARGKELTTYLNEQLSQSKDFVKTAQDAADALKAAEGD